MINRIASQAPAITVQEVLPKIDLNTEADVVLPIGAKTNQLNRDQTPHQDPNTKEKIEKAVKGMNDFLSVSNTHLKFQYHEKLKEYYVTIVDGKTDEVVKEIPSKKLLDMFAAMNEYIGLMVDKKI
jgi:flagellar protein FlaG